MLRPISRKRSRAFFIGGEERVQGREVVVILRYSEGSVPFDITSRSFGVPQDDKVSPPEFPEPRILNPQFPTSHPR
jgi:hypothetical protein